MKHMSIRKTLLVTAMLGGMMNVAPAQTYTNGQTGLFGNPELWNNKSNVNFDNVNDSLSKSKNSPFDGRKFRGGPVATIVAGKLVWNSGRGLLAG